MNVDPNAKFIQEMKKKYAGVKVKRHFLGYGDFIGKIETIWYKESSHTFFARVFYPDEDAEDIPLPELKNYIVGPDELQSATTDGSTADQKSTDAPTDSTKVAVVSQQPSEAATLPPKGTVFRHAKDLSNKSLKMVRLIARRHNAQREKELAQNPNMTKDEIAEAIKKHGENVKTKSKYEVVMKKIDDSFHRFLPEHAEDIGRLLLNKISRDKRRRSEDEKNVTERKRRRESYLGPEDTKKSKKGLEIEDKWKEYEETLRQYLRTTKRRLLQGDKKSSTEFRNTMELDLIYQLEIINKMKRLPESVEKIVKDDIAFSDQLVEALLRLEQEEKAEDFDEIYEDADALKEELPTQSVASAQKERVEEEMKQCESMKKAIEGTREDMTEFQQRTAQTISLLKTVAEKRHRRLNTAYSNHFNKARSTTASEVSYHTRRNQDITKAYQLLERAMQAIKEKGDSICHIKCPQLTAKVKELIGLYEQQMQCLKTELERAENILKLSCKWHPREQQQEGNKQEEQTRPNSNGQATVTLMNDSTQSTG